MGYELEVEWFNPNVFPNAPLDQRGAWTLAWGGDGDELEVALRTFEELAKEGKVSRVIWRPL